MKTIFKRFKYKRWIKNQLKGLKIKNINSSYRVSFYITEKTGKDEIEQLLESLPSNLQFMFFDKHHPQISDPGAYVSVQKIDCGYMYILGNHGWSDEWKKIQFNKLVEYVMKNIEFSDDCFEVYPCYKKVIIGQRS